MNFWETFRQATLDQNKWWRYHRLGAVRQIEHYYVTIPAFTVSNVDQADASFIVTEFRLNNQTPYSIIGHLEVPDDVQFCLAVRSPQNNDTGLYVQRYKLWENVGENLVFPFYEGQRINPLSAFEIWTLVPNAGSVENPLPIVIPLSFLNTPSSEMFCCQGLNNELTLTQYCSLFALKNDSANYDIPIVFDHCLNDGIPAPSDDEIGIITEAGDERITTEEDDPLITEHQNL